MTMQAIRHAIADVARPPTTSRRSIAQCAARRRRGAEGVYLHTRDGRRILDLYGGHAVAALGYGHPRWLAALERQARVAALPEQRRADRRARARRDAAGRASRASVSTRVFFVNSGAEANENALKLALQDHRPDARSSRSKAASTAAPPPRAPSPGARARSGTASRTRRSTSSSSRGATSPRSRASSARDTAAVIVEPVQGVGGAVDLGAPFLAGAARALRRGRRAADLRRSAVRHGPHRAIRSRPTCTASRPT